MASKTSWFLIIIVDNFCTFFVNISFEGLKRRKRQKSILKQKQKKGKYAVAEKIFLFV